MSDVKAKDISYLAWLGLAAAGQLDLGLTREQLVCLHKECLAVARLHNDFKLNRISCLSIIPLIWDIPATSCDLEYLETSYKLAKTHGDANLEMIMSYAMATEYAELRRFEEAILYGEKCLGIAKEIGDKSAEKYVYFILLKTNFELEKFNEAISYGKLCLNLIDQSVHGYSSIQTCVYYYLGNAHYSLKQYDTALSYTEKCREEAQLTADAETERKACLHLADIYVSLNRHEDAIRFGKKSLEMTKQANDLELESEASCLLGMLYSDLKQFNKSLFYTKNTIDAARKTCNQDVEMAACVAFADTYNSLEQHDDAIIWGKKCIDLALNGMLVRNYLETKTVKEREQVDLLISGAYLALGVAHLELEEYEDCISSSKKAIAMIKTHKIEKRKEEGYFLLGQAYEALQRYDECILHFKKCIEITELTNSKNITMPVHLLLGHVYLNNLKNYDDAMVHFKKCLEVANETGNVFFEMSANIEIAAIYYNWFKDADNAIAHMKKALATAEEIGDKDVEAQANLELGKCYELKKDDGNALFFSKKSIDVAKQIGNRVVEANAYLLIARIHNEESKHEAIAFNERCNDIAHEIGDETLKINGHYQISESLFAANRYEEAIFHANKCIAMANRLDNKYVEMMAWLLLGEMYDKLQKYDEVVRCTERCVGVENEEKKINAYWLLGRAYRFLKKYDDSINNLHKCLDIAKTMGEKRFEMQAYDFLGDTLLSCGRTNDALSCYEKCLAIACEMGDKETEMNAYIIMGNLHFNIEKLEDAISYYTQCLDIAKKNGNRGFELNAHADLAETYLCMGRNDDAICHSKIALGIAQETGDKENQVAAYLLGKACFNKNLYEDAILYGEKCLNFVSTEQETAACDTKGLGGTARCNERMRCILIPAYLVKSYCCLKKREEAYICIQKGIKIMKQMNDKSDKMMAALSLCEMYSFMEEFEEAIQYGKQSAELAIETGNKRFERDCYFLLRNVSSKAKNYKDYLMYSKKCVQMMKEHGTRINEMYSLYSLGDAFLSSKQYENAIVTLKRCIEMADKAGDEYSNLKGDAYYLLAQSYDCQAQFKDAVHYYKICIGIAKKIQSQTLLEAKALFLCADALMSLNQYGEAHTYITEGLTIARSLKMDFLIDEFNFLLRILYQSIGMNEEIASERNSNIDDEGNYGRHNYRKEIMCIQRCIYHRSRENYEEAIACLKDAMITAASDGHGDIFVAKKYPIFERDIAEMYVSQGQYDTALQHYREGLALALRFDNKHGQALIHFGIGEVYYELKQMEDAEESLRESIKCFEFMFCNMGSQDRFKIAIAETFNDVHKLLLKLLIETNKTEEALLLADHFRALALKDILISNYGMKEETATTSLQYSDVQTLVSSNDYAILLFSVCHGVIYTFLVEAGDEYTFSVRVFKYCDDSFDTIIEKSYSEMNVRQLVNCENRSLDDLKERDGGDDSPNNRGHTKEPSENSEDISMTNASETFYRRILPKLILQATKEEIVLIPDGSLHKVPFVALQDPDTGRYLSETKRIRLAPSIATLKLVSENSGQYQNSGALIIGDPRVGKVMFDGKEEEFVPLENAFAEVLLVSKVFNDTPLIGEKATKPAIIQILKEGVAVVHIAAHGSLSKGTIALAPSPEIRARKPIPDEDDYMLTMADVQQTNVRAQLVVLSCCHSGRGEIKAEGVVGMCRAFLASGARAVVASLWAIDDEATADFMFQFYTRIMDGKSAGVSLQQAMDKMRNDPEFSEPKYWAPFFLMGDDVTFKT